MSKELLELTAILLFFGGPFILWFLAWTIDRILKHRVQMQEYKANALAQQLRAKQLEIDLNDSLIELAEAETAKLQAEIERIQAESGLLRLKGGRHEQA